jgi:all-trans-retinol 13,14-reductase
VSRRFDAIVIGSGLGGLTAGALCAKSGLRVLVLERNDTLGGAATVCRHNGLAIETSLHEIDGLDEGDPKLPLIRALGLMHDLNFVEVGDLYEVRGGPLDLPFVLPHGSDAALKAAIARFPHQKAGLEEYFRRLLALRGAVSVAAHHREDRTWWLLHGPEAVRALWPVLREGSATVGDVLGELFDDDEAVKLALAANLVYYHDDPDQLLFSPVRYPASVLRHRWRPLRARWLAGVDRSAGLDDQERQGRPPHGARGKRTDHSGWPCDWGPSCRPHG